MNLRTLRTAVAAAALSVCVAATAAAAPFNLRIAPGGFGGPAQGNIFASDALWREIDITVNGDRYGNFGVGLFGLEFDDAAVNGENWQPLLTFCLEVAQFIDFSTPFTAVNVASALSGPAGNEIRRLWQTEFANATDELAADSKDRAAAFQIAIWEILDGRDGLTTGDFNLHTTDPNLLALINSYLASAATPGELANLSVLQNEIGQDQLYPTGRGPGGADDPVPAPATLALLGAAMIGLGALRRRRQG